MFTFMVVLIALIAAVLILVILLQSGQGSGLSGIAQGGAARQVLGTRQAPDALEKATWTLGTIFITLCVITNFFIDTGDQRSIIQERAQEGAQQQQTQQPPGQPSGSGDAAPLPGQGGGGQGGSQGGTPSSGEGN